MSARDDTQIHHLASSLFDQQRLNTHDDSPPPYRSYIVMAWSVYEGILYALVAIARDHSDAILVPIGSSLPRATTPRAAEHISRILVESRDYSTAASHRAASVRALVVISHDASYFIESNIYFGKINISFRATIALSPFDFPSPHYIYIYMLQRFPKLFCLVARAIIFVIKVI